MILDYSEPSDIFYYRQYDFTEDQMDAIPDPIDEIDALAGVDKRCRYCRTRLREPLEGMLRDGYDNEVRLLVCHRCGWWCDVKLDRVPVNRDCSAEWRMTPAALRKYSVRDITVPVAALRREILKRPSVLYEINPTKMEHLAGSVLQDFIDCEVVHVGRSGDGGIALLLIDGAKRLGAAALNVLHGPPMRGQHAVAKLGSVLGAMEPKDVGQFHHHRSTITGRS
jgi:hypothetical protein